MQDCLVCKNSRYLFNEINKTFSKPCKCILKEKYRKFLTDKLYYHSGVLVSPLETELVKVRNVALIGSIKHTFSHLKWYLLTKPLNYKFTIADISRLMTIFCENDSEFKSKFDVINNLDLLVITLFYDRPIKDIGSVIKYFVEARGLSRKQTWICYSSTDEIKYVCGPDSLTYLCNPKKFIPYRLTIENTKDLKKSD